MDSVSQTLVCILGCDTFPTICSPFISKSLLGGQRWTNIAAVLQMLIQLSHFHVRSHHFTVSVMDSEVLHSFCIWSTRLHHMVWKRGPQRLWVWHAWPRSRYSQCFYNSFSYICSKAVNSWLESNYQPGTRDRRAGALLLDILALQWSQCSSALCCYILQGWCCHFQLFRRLQKSLLMRIIGSRAFSATSSKRRILYLHSRDILDSVLPTNWGCRKPASWTLCSS